MGFDVVKIPVKPAEAAAARVAMAEVGQVAGQKIGLMLGPNCTTTIAGVLTEGGVALPMGAATNTATLYVAMKYPLALGAAASGSAAVVTGVGAAALYTPGPPPDQRR
jgi:hypothetical protein